MSNLNVKNTLSCLGMHNLANICMSPIFNYIYMDLFSRNNIDVMSSTLQKDILDNKDLLAKLQNLNDTLGGCSIEEESRVLPIITKSMAIPILSYAIIFSFIMVCIMILTGYAKVDGAIAGSIIGYISAKAEQIISFYFGNSNGSQEKDIMLANSVPSKTIATKSSMIEKFKGKKP